MQRSCSSMLYKSYEDKKISNFIFIKLTSYQRALRTYTFTELDSWTYFLVHLVTIDASLGSKSVVEKGSSTFFCWCISKTYLILFLVMDNHHDHYVAWFSASVHVKFRRYWRYHHWLVSDKSLKSVVKFWHENHYCTIFSFIVESSLMESTRSKYFTNGHLRWTMIS